MLMCMFGYIGNMCGCYKTVRARRNSRSEGFVRFGITGLAVLCVLIDSTLGFNLDIKDPIVKYGDDRSHFGYSVAQHLDQNQGWILVGAPQAQTRQPGIIVGGAVYRCKIPVHNDTNFFDSPCQYIPFDSTGNNNQNDEQGILKQIEDKSYQAFGSTVVSSGPNGYILACAPRYVYLSRTFDKREPVGTCYLAQSLRTSFEEYSPCRGEVDLYDGTVDQYHKQGYCMAGFSASMSKNGNRLLIGAPGAYYWQGQVYSYWLDQNNRRFRTDEEGASEDDKYRGYSSASGNFNNDTIEDFVVGVPRAERLLGMVELYTQDLQKIRNITGEQIGAYFGYSVAVQDLNGDSLDDIIVGAPLYSDYKSVTSYDTGRVYIYYQSSKRKFRPKKRYDILDGHEPKSRFGLSVAGMKDINIDTFNDLVIGAPYGGKDGQGAVYIYHGSTKGIITDVSQIINGKDIQSSISTFGFSLSAGHDLDKNLYPDLLVGAYESHAAVFLKARPVVRMAVSLRLDPKNITLEEKNCQLPWNKKVQVACVMVRTCLDYSGEGLANHLDFDLLWKLDTLKNVSKRMFHLDTNFAEYTLLNYRLTKNDVICHRFIVYIRNSIRDKLTPLKVDFTYKLKEDQPAALGSSRQRRSIPPVLDQHTPQTVIVQGNITKECGGDFKCIPDLSVNTERVYTFHGPIKLGSKALLNIIVMVSNTGPYAEDAYETMLYIELPSGVSFDSVQNKNYLVPFSCEFAVRNTTDVVICDMGNPLPKNARANFTLKVSPSELDGTQSTLDFHFKINSSNPENKTDIGDNTDVFHIDVVQQGELLLAGRIPSQEQIRYNKTGVSLYKGTGYGPQVIHEYKIWNIGDTPIKSSVIDVYWPSHDDQGNNLLYITSPAEVLNHKGQCKTYTIVPENATHVWNSEGGDHDNFDVVLEQQRLSRHRRSTRQKRDTTKQIYCNKKWCTFIKCTLEYMPGNMLESDAAVVRIESRIWTETLVKRGLTSEPFHLTSQAVAKVDTMPNDIKIDPRTFNVEHTEVKTYVNAELLAPQTKGVEPWKIAVAVVAGLLLLLLIVVLLWWCGFFRRQRPQNEPAYNKPLMTNGQQGKVDIVARPYE